MQKLLLPSVSSLTPLLLPSVSSQTPSSTVILNEVKDLKEVRTDPQILR